mmetsp:Transcript_74131/g.102981  ORF Transcript_74131/g.102981 Transcript_74131/m.102981 type:complete len:82 (-) Transcript_74131:1321-1566(-)
MLQLPKEGSKDGMPEKAHAEPRAELAIKLAAEDTASGGLPGPRTFKLSPRKRECLSMLTAAREMDATLSQPSSSDDVQLST